MNKTKKAVFMKAWPFYMSVILGSHEIVVYAFWSTFENLFVQSTRPALWYILYLFGWRSMDIYFDLMDMLCYNDW